MNEMNVLDYVKKKGVCQSLILTHVLVESTQYALRLTPDNKYGVQEIEVFLREISKEWIYSIENSKKGKEHYHIILWSSEEEETVRVSVRGFLLQFFPDKAKRGDANKQYNLSEVEDLETAVTYLLKDGGVIKYSKGVDPDSITKLQKQSYKKFSKEEFAKAFEELKKRFKDESPKIGDMMESIVKLKGIYRQPINMVHIYQQCISFDVHNHPSMGAFYVQEFLSRYI